MLCDYVVTYDVGKPVQMKGANQNSELTHVEQGNFKLTGPTRSSLWPVNAKPERTVKLS